MLYWFFIIVLIVEIFLYIKVDDLYCNSVLEIMMMLTGVIILILTIFIFGFNLESKSTKVRLESTYKTLLEYNSELNCSQNEHYISEVILWNETISVGKEMQRDFWVGVFIPNIYDEFDIITLNETTYEMR